MPRYFFRIVSDNDTAPDPDGVEMVDLKAARAEAIAGIREIAADRIRFGNQVKLDDRLEITDADGQLVLSLPFRDCIDFSD
jgi:Domain of unknown function (DUF6894)